MTNTFFGEISEAWEKEWGKGHDPYDVLNKMYGIDGFFPDGSPFGWTSEHCTDEIAVDWGSYAWKCKGKEIIELQNHSSVSDDYKIDSIEPDKTYGVVLIEEY